MLGPVMHWIRINFCFMYSFGKHCFVHLI